MEQQQISLKSLSETSELDGTSALNEFNALIAEHGSQIVESPRMPGVSIPLATLMNACPKPVDDSNAYAFLTEAKSLIEAAISKKKLT